jgi:hypothetical protein|nr:MAG TPA: hypothetical protein [Caudoviricetes sp.]
MERLTERYVPNDEKKGIAGIKVFESEDKIPLVKVLSGEYLYPAIEKLADYEDLEEQGLLVRLPCPIGTTVWDICGMDIRENVVSGLEYDKGAKWFLWANEDECLGELNVLVFLNREEAEKKLEDIQNDKT